MVGGQEKLDLLKQSKGLIFPVLWDEPFGLAITESLYCGAPVFGTPYGSLRELVLPEVGYLSEYEDELVRHIVGGYNYSSRICHEYARDCFNSRVMALAYLDKYSAVLEGRALSAPAPHPVKPFERYKMK